MGITKPTVLNIDPYAVRTKIVERAIPIHTGKSDSLTIESPGPIIEVMIATIEISITVYDTTTARYPNRR